VSKGYFEEWLTNTLFRLDNYTLDTHFGVLQKLDKDISKASLDTHHNNHVSFKKNSQQVFFCNI